MGSRSIEHDHLTPNAQPKGRRVSKLGELNIDLYFCYIHFTVYDYITKMNASTVIHLMNTCLHIS